MVVLVCVSEWALVRLDRAQACGAGGGGGTRAQRSAATRT